MYNRILSIKNHTIKIMDFGYSSNVAEQPDDEE
jgi:hypothetical protein